MIAIALLLSPGVVRAQALANAHLRAEFGPRGLTAITDRGDGHRYRLADEGFTITIDSVTYSSASLPAPRVRVVPDGVVYRYRSAGFTFDVTYAIRAGWRFVSKEIAISRASARAYRVRDVTVLRPTFGGTPIGLFTPPGARPALGTRDYGAAVRLPGQRSLLLVAQNPFLEFTLDGNVGSLRYAPEMDWQGSYGPFPADRAFIAPVRLSGRRLPARMPPEWSAPTDTTPGLDEAEVGAFTAMVRASLIYRPAAPVNVVVGWCANDYQIDVGTPEGRAEYRRLFDQAAALGARYVLYAPSNSALSRREESVDDWSWEHVLWLGLGQRIRRAEWDPRTSPIPPSVREMLDAARDRRLGLLAYVYPVLPFAQNPAWLVPSRRDPRRMAASLGNRALQDWLIDELVAFHDRTGIAGYAFDHTFLTYDGSSGYAQWWGWRRVMEALRRRIPGIVIDGRQAYHLYGPWSWLAGSYPHPTFNDEQPESFTPFPDLHFDRVSADRERYTAYRYRNYEFAPSELVPGFMTHQTSRSDDRGEMPSVQIPGRGTVLTSFRARDWDYLGWRYSVLSSIAVGGWNNVINMIPARDSAEYASFGERDRAWLRRWLDWTAAHRELLRRTRTILGPPGIGRIDGTAAVAGDRGFVFLFNPDPRRQTARLPLDQSIGLTVAGRYLLREIEPVAGRAVAAPRRGLWSQGDTATVTLDGASAVVLELAPAAPRPAVPLLFGVPGAATIRAGELVLSGVTGEPGTTVPVLVVLPPGVAVTRASVNGVTVPIAARHDDVVELSVRFAGAPFRTLEPLVEGDAGLVDGRVSGRFTVPERIFAQLRARRAAWPIPWTAEDSLTTWLVPERLLLYAAFQAPDDSWTASLTIDGASVLLRKAYTAVRVVPSTFVGLYADLSGLAADRPHHFELELPPPARQPFLGLFFENVEPERTAAIVPPGS